MHQDSCNMAYIGHPVAETLFMGHARPQGHGHFYMLHSGFTHPTTGELVEFTAEEPAIFKETLEKLRSVTVIKRISFLGGAYFCKESEICQFLT